MAKAAEVWTYRVMIAWQGVEVGQTIQLDRPIAPAFAPNVLLIAGPTAPILTPSIPREPTSRKAQAG